MLFSSEELAFSLLKFMFVKRLSVTLAMEALAIWTLLIVVPLVFTMAGVEEGTAAKTR